MWAVGTFAFLWVYPKHLKQELIFAFKFQKQNKKTIHGTTSSESRQNLKNIYFAERFRKPYTYIYNFIQDIKIRFFG